MNDNRKNKKITLGLIAARKNSKGVKNKNLIKINNNYIVKTAVDLALSSAKIDKVVLSSDCHRILNLVKENKKLFKLKRSVKIATDKTPMLPVIKDAIIKLEKSYKYKVSKLVIFDPTSPLRKLSDIENGLKIFNKFKPDLLLSVHNSTHNPYFSMVEKKGKYYNLSKNLKASPGSRQEVPVVYEINTLVWIYSREAIFKINQRIPKKTKVLITPEERSIDIDTKHDIKKINYYLKKK